MTQQVCLVFGGPRPTTTRLKPTLSMCRRRQTHDTGVSGFPRTSYRDGAAWSHLAVKEAPRVALVEDKRRHGVVRGGEAEALLGDSYVLVDLVYIDREQ